MSGLFAPAKSSASSAFSTIGQSTPFALGSSLTVTTTALQSIKPSVSFSFGAPTVTPPTGFHLSTQPSQTASGLLLAQSTQPSTSAGSSLLLKTLLPVTTSNLLVPATVTAAGVTPSAFRLPGPIGISTTSTATSTSLASGFTFSGLPATTLGTTVSTAAAKGLGGLDPKAFSHIGGGAGVTSSNTAGVAVGATASSNTGGILQAEMPAELQQLVVEFINYVKSQKLIRAEASKLASTQCTELCEELLLLRRQLAHVSAQVNAVFSELSQLKQAIGQELTGAEIATRTHDIPLGLQYEHTAPQGYFERVCGSFVEQMLKYGQQLADLELQLETVAPGGGFSRHAPGSSSHTTPLSAEELRQLLEHLYATLTTLASRLHPLHNAVQTLRSTYLDYCSLNHLNPPSSGGFSRSLGESGAVRDRGYKGGMGELVGPSPFARVGDISANVVYSLIQQQSQSSSQKIGTGLGTLGGAKPLTSGLFGSSGNTTTGLFGTQGLGGATGGGLFPSVGTTTSARLFPTLQSSNVSSGLFGGAKPAATGLFGGGLTAGFGGGLTAAGVAQPAGTSGFSFGVTPGLTGTSPFTLKPPPFGNKRNKSLK